MFLFRSHDTQKTTINPSFSFHYFGIVNYELKTNNRRLQSLQGRRKKPARGTGRTKKKCKSKREREGRESPSSFLPIPLPFRLLFLSRLPRWLSFARFGVKRRKRFDTASALKSRADF